RTPQADSELERDRRREVGREAHARSRNSFSSFAELGNLSRSIPSDWGEGSRNAGAGPAEIGIENGSRFGPPPSGGRPRSLRGHSPRARRERLRWLELARRLLRLDGTFEYARDARLDRDAELDRIDAGLERAHAPVAERSNAAAERPEQ